MEPGAERPTEREIDPVKELEAAFGAVGDPLKVPEGPDDPEKPVVPPMLVVASTLLLPPYAEPLELVSVEPAAEALWDGKLGGRALGPEELLGAARPEVDGDSKVLGLEPGLPVVERDALVSCWTDPDSVLDLPVLESREDSGEAPLILDGSPAVDDAGPVLEPSGRPTPDDVDTVARDGGSEAGPEDVPVAPEGAGVLTEKGGRYDAEFDDWTEDELSFTGEAELLFPGEDGRLGEGEGEAEPGTETVDVVDASVLGGDKTPGDVACQPEDGRLEGDRAGDEAADDGGIDAKTLGVLGLVAPMLAVDGEAGDVELHEPGPLGPGRLEDGSPEGDGTKGGRLENGESDDEDTKGVGPDSQALDELRLDASRLEREENPKEEGLHDPETLGDAGPGGSKLGEGVVLELHQLLTHCTGSSMINSASL